MSLRRTLAGAALALALLGVGGYAYLNPAFAATCTTTFKGGVACVQRWTDSAKTSLQKSELGSSVAKELRERAGKNYVQAKFKLSDLWATVVKKLTARAAPAAAPPAAACARPAPAPAPEQAQPPAPRTARSSLSPGRTIVNGHAFAKHGRELGFATKEQMAIKIDQIIARPSRVKHLIRGRTAYWDNATGIVVIHDPSTADGGTAFRPSRGSAYYDNLR